MDDKISTLQTANGQKISYLTVKKESQSGITSNLRILVLVNDKSIGYISNFDKKNPKESITLSNIKKLVEVKDIRNSSIEGKKLVLLINEPKDGKLKSIKWVFEMLTEQLVNSWIEIIETQKSPHPSRKPTVEEELANRQKDRSNAENNSRVTPSVKDISEHLSQSMNGQQAQEQKQQPPLLVAKQSFQNRSQDAYSFDGEKPIPQTAQDNPPPISTKQTHPHQAREEQDESQYKQVDSQTPNQLRTLGSSISAIVEKQSFKNYFRPNDLKQTVDDVQFKSFIDFCERQLISIVDNNEICTLESYSKKGVTVSIVRSQMKQIPGDCQVCDEGILKSYLNTLKNMDYIWSVVKGDEKLSKVFVMPMNCLIELGGRIAYFACEFDIKCEQGSDPQKQQQLDYSGYFQRLADQTKVHKTILEKSSNIKIEKVSNKFVISAANQYLPRLATNTTMIRPQAFAISVAEGNYQMKTGRKEEQQQKKYFMNFLQSNINVLASNFSKLEDYVLHPQQFSDLLHEHGLNINSMRTIYHKVSNSFIKGIILTEAALRSFKMIYRNEVQGIEKQQMKNHTIELLNILLDQKSQESTRLWVRLTTHSQTYFGLPVGKLDMNKGYFLMGLQHKLGIRISTRQSSCSSIFETREFVKDVSFKPKTKSCRIFRLPEFLGRMAEVNHLELQPLSKDTYYPLEICNSIIDEFVLQSKNFPYYVMINQLEYEKILEILSFYNDAKTLQHLSIYRTAQTRQSHLLTSSYHRRKLSQIRWMIKKEEIQQKEISSKIDQLKRVLEFYFGAIHPFYTEIYDLMFMYYRSTREYEKSLVECKASLANSIQLCGGNNMHIKLAEDYSELGVCYFEWRKMNDAISHYKKAKNILEFNERTKSKQYATILIKLATIYIIKFKDNEAYMLLETGLHILEDGYENSYSEIVDCLQLMTRCSSNCTVQQSIMIQSVAAIKLGIQEQDLASDVQFVRLLRVVVDMYFSIHRKQITMQLVYFLESMSDSLQSGSKETEKSIEIIKQFLVDETFFETLDGFKQKAEKANRFKSKGPKQESNCIRSFKELSKSLILSTSEGFMLAIMYNHM